VCRGPPDVCGCAFGPIVRPVASAETASRKLAGGGEAIGGIRASCERIQKAAAPVLRSFETDEEAVA